MNDPDTIAFVDMVMGQPYEPKGLHCWELVRQGQNILFNRELPPVLVAPERRAELVGLMALRHTYAGWVEVDQPVHGCVVFMTKNGHDVSRAACHAGIWLDLDGGGILHTDEPHGVVFEKISELELRNWGDFGYHTPA